MMADAIFGIFLLGISLVIASCLWRGISLMNGDDHYLYADDYTDIKSLAIAIHKSKAK